MEIKSNSPKIKQGQIAKELRFSSFALQRYGNDMKLQSFYRTNQPKRKQTLAHVANMTSNDLKRPQLTSKQPTTENYTDSASVTRSVDKPII